MRIHAGSNFRKGQDETPVREIDTLVVGQKALLAAEAYVLGLFHLYQNVYCHKATRSAEKIFSALLTRIFQLATDGSVDRTGLPSNHPLVRFAFKPDDLDTFCDLDDHVVWGAMPLLSSASDKCVSELAMRLLKRKLYKALDVTALVEGKVASDGTEEKTEEKRRKIEAQIRGRLRESGLLELSDSAPVALDDICSRDPYQRGQGDDATLTMIYAIDRTGKTEELSKLSKVVGALKKYEVYRIYYRNEDQTTKEKLEKMIEEFCHA